MNELFLKIINMSISASWLVLAVLILRLLLKKAPKWVRVLLWGLVAVRLMCPFSFESIFSLMPSAETIPMHIEMDAAPAIDSGINAIDSVVNPVIGAAFTPAPAASANPLQIWISVLAVVWLFGIAVLLSYTAVSYWRLHRKVATAVRYRGRIYQSESVDSPFVLGIIKPQIYLPFQIEEWDLEYVIAHEQAHIRRKDHWWKPLGFLLLTVHWFNPLMWLAYVLLCRDIELACDEKVIRHLENWQRADYSQALVACSVNRRMIAACPLAFGEVGVKGRVKSVMNYRKPTFWIILVSVVACVVAAVCFLTNPKQDSFTLRIVVPAGSQEAVVYAYEEITPLGNYITVSAGDGLGDTEVSLKPVQVNTETAYNQTAYLTPGMPVRMEVEKGGWFQVGVNIQNPSDEDMEVFLKVKNVEVRISDEHVEEPLIDSTSVTEPSGTAESGTMIIQDAAYYLELASGGKSFQDMSGEQYAGILEEYDTLLADYTLFARVSTDNTTGYILGYYRGDAGNNPFAALRTMEFSLPERDSWQLLYQESYSEVIEQSISEGREPEAGYVIKNSYVHYAPNSGLIMIQPRNMKSSLSSAFLTYCSPGGRDYIADAVSRGIALGTPDEPYLTVYMISEKYGEISEKIPLSSEGAAAILKEERKQLTDGYGFAASLHVDGETVYYMQTTGVPQTALDLAVQKCDYRFASPSLITGPILQAELDCDWLDAPVYAQEEDLERLREILVNAEFGFVGDCGYGAKLTLTLTGGEKLTVFKGCDSCDTVVFGSFGGYFIGDSENTEFWKMFGMDADTKEFLE